MPDSRPVFWVMTELYFPEETSTGYYMTRIAEGLAADFNVKVLCGQPNYSLRGTRAPRRETRNGVEIFRVPAARLNKNNLLFRLINMATLGFSMSLAVLRRIHSGDRVLVVTTPPNLPLIAAICSLARGAAYTLLIHDNYPEILIATGKVRRGSFSARFIEAVNRWIYKHASKIIVVGRDMAELAEEKTRGLDIPVVTIPNWAETDSISPMPKNENPLLVELGLSGKFVFLYAGNFGRPNDVESIVECAKLLESNDNVHFIFLGDGAKRPLIETAVHGGKLSNITLLPSRPRADQQIFLNACDVAIVSLINGMRGVSVPSRLYNILAAGKPVLGITEPGSEVARVIGEDRVGWITPPSNPKLLAEIISKIAAGGADFDTMGKHARDAALEKYSLQSAIARYRSELRPEPENAKTGLNNQV